MAGCRINKFNSHHHTFLTNRFDRTSESRLQSTSAMPQLGFYDEEYDASYLEIAQFLWDNGANTKADLAQKRLSLHALAKVAADNWWAWWLKLIKIDRFKAHQK